MRSINDPSVVKNFMRLLHHKNLFQSKCCLFKHLSKQMVGEINLTDQMNLEHR